MTLTREIIIFTVLMVTLFVLVVYFRWRESKYLKKKTSEVFSPSLREAIEKERGENLEKREKFEEALRKAGEK